MDDCKPVYLTSYFTRANYVTYSLEIRRRQTDHG